MKPRLAFMLAASALASAAHAAEPNPDVLRFDISRYEVHGNTLLPPAEIARLLAPYTGAGRDFGDVQRALEALIAAYQAAGYSVVTVNLPEQELDRGVVRLDVVQTRIGQVRVSGQRHVDAANVRRALPPLREGETPKLDRISAALRLANEHPARKITMKLQGAEREDEVDALLEVADQQPWKGMLNIDNTGNAQTGKTHVGAVLQHANLFGRDHVASLQYTTTAEKPSQMAVWGVGYHIPLYGAGDSVDLFGSYSNVDSGTILGGLVALSGKGAVFGARYNRTLARQGDYQPRLVFGLDHKAFKNSVLFGGANYGNDVTVHPLSVNYLGMWTLPNGDASASLTVLRNIPGGNSGRQADFDLARPGAPAGFSVLRFAGAYNRVLGGDWQLRAIGNGQWTPHALIPGEQFGIGGAASVRGFGEREMANDNGISGNLELYTPTLCPARSTWQCRALVFYDAAHARRNDALAGELRSTTIGSIGVGLRYLVGASLNVQLDLGHIVQAGASAGADKNKIHLRVGLSL